MKIAIAGKPEKTTNYIRYVESIGAVPVVTLLASEISDCRGLLLPGGGDITPAFYGERNHGSADIDTELDILQLQAFDLAVQTGMPVLGICKGLQIINVGLGGSIIQDLPCADCHRYLDADQYHEVHNLPGSFLHHLYGEIMVVNSAHHQGLGKLGRGVQVVSRCPLDQCVEGICHKYLPVIGVQWHPERLDPARTEARGTALLSYFLYGRY